MAGSVLPACLIPVLGDQILASIDTTAGGASLTVPATAEYASVQLEGTPGTNDVRFLDNGGAPVATSKGQLRAAGKQFWIVGRTAMIAARMIQEGASAGKASVLYYKQGHNVE